MDAMVAKGDVTQSERSMSVTAERTVFALTFSAADCLLGVIERALTGNKAVLIDVPKLGAVWVDPKARLYSGMILHPSEYFRTPSNAARVSHDVVAPLNSKRRPIDELLWLAGFYGSGGALLDRGRPHDVVELKYWPNLTRLPHLPSTMRLCALLSRSPTSISLAYRMLHIPPQDVLQIYSAALAADMIRVVCAQPADKSVAAPAHSNRVIERVASFWESMLNRIAGL